MPKEKPYAFSRTIQKIVGGLSTVLKKTRTFSDTTEYIRVPRPVLDAGVSLLLSDSQPVYIGQSECVMSRLCNHVVNEPKDFDDVLIIPQADGRDKYERMEIEKLLITAYKPKLNIKGNPDHYYNSIQYLMDEVKAGRRELV